MSQRPKLTLFVDIVSPFAYMAFYVTQNSKVFEQCEITYIPIFLGGVMKACDNRPPISIKNKAQFIEQDRLRWSKYCNIPMSASIPEGFPPMTLHVMRALSVIQQSHPVKLVPAIAALYKAMWVSRLPIAEPKTFTQVLGEVLGEDVAKGVVEESTQAPAKQHLSKNTELALEEGAFGLPWFVATNARGEKETFWGFDHLGLVLAHLGLDRGQEFRALL